MSLIKHWNDENFVDEIMEGFFKRKKPFSDSEYVEFATAQMRFMCELLELYVADESSNNFDIKIDFKKILEVNESCIDIDKKSEFLKIFLDFSNLMINLNRFSIEDNSNNYEHH